MDPVNSLNGQRKRSLQFMFVDRRCGKAEFKHRLDERDHVCVTREPHRFELWHRPGDGQVRQVHRHYIDGCV